MYSWPQVQCGFGSQMRVPWRFNSAATIDAISGFARVHALSIPRFHCAHVATGFHSGRYAGWSASTAASNRTVWQG